MIKKRIVRNFIPLFLAIAILLPSLYIYVNAADIPITQTERDVAEITTTVYEVSEYEELQEELLTQYPTIEAEVEVSDGEYEDTTLEVSSWDCETYEVKAGTYEFTPTIDGYKFADDVSSVITVIIQPNTIIEVVTALDSVNADTIDDAIEQLPPEITMTVATSSNDLDVTFTVEDWIYEDNGDNSYTFTPYFGEDFETNYVYETDEPYIIVYFSEVSAVAVASDNEETTEEGYIEGIEEFTVQFVSGATLDDYENYVWTPSSSGSGHKFKYRVNFAFSGTGMIAANTIEIRIPASILTDKDGNSADTVYMSYPSSDELEDLTEDELAQLDGFAYYVDGDEIVVYNFTEISSATEGYFEVSYATSKSTYYYYDYDPEETQDYEDGSTVFYATIEADGITASAEGDSVYINTSVEIDSVVKYYPSGSSDWKSSWGTKPSDIDAYSYLVWEIYTEIDDNLTSTYDYTLIEDTLTYAVTYSDGTTVTGDVSDGGIYFVAYKLQGGKYTVLSSEEYSGFSVTSKNLTSTYRYDYVVVALSSDVFADAVSYTITNTATSQVASTDDVDDSTSKSASKSYSWTQPKWVTPSGSFNIFKYGNENYSKYWGDYINYSLDTLQGEDTTAYLENIKYYVNMIGYAYPWTVRDDWATTEGYYTTSSDGSIIPNYNAYGYKDVTYVITDDTLYPLNSDGTDLNGNDLANNTGEESLDTYGQIEAYADTDPLESTDYDFSYLTYSVAFTDAVRDSNGDPTVDEDYEYNLTTTVSSDDVITLYVKVDGEWLTAGTFNLYTSTWTADDEGGSYVSSMTSSKITFNTGVDGYKMELSNSYYKTVINVYAYVTLYATENVQNWTGTEADGTQKDVVLLRNAVILETYEEETTESGETEESLIVEIAKVIGDRLIRSETDSYISKTHTATTNDTVNKTVTVSWRIYVKETVTTGSDTTNYISQSSGTFYDLLPYGHNYEADSVSVITEEGYLDESEYTVTTVDNYNNTGRTMLIVQIDASANYYYVYFNTVISWNTIIDVGVYALNSVAYETGNDSIADGYADTGGDITESSLMTDLDSETDDEKFIYSESLTTIDIELSQSTGLTKSVKASSDSDYSQSTTVTAGETYSYKLRFANTYSTTAKDIVFYDSLENYSDSMWYGTLTAVDITQAESLGIAPVVYISTIEGLDIEGNCDLTDTSVWTVVTDDTDLSTAKAVAIDLSKDSDGNDFILEAGGSVFAVLYMEAPENDTSGVENEYPVTYNNIYATMTIGTSSGSETTNTLYYNYTAVSYAITGDFTLLKVNEQDNTETVSGITFILSGTSDYGTEIYLTKTTNSSGIINFTDIEKGTYTLQEYGTYDDWIADHTEHTVVIDSDGNVTIDGEVVTTYTFENTPRIHADVTFKKADSVSGAYISGVTFRLYGTSDYGNTVNEYTESTSVGRVTFSNIEKGTYTLIETVAADGYFVDGAIYIVKIDSYGNVSISKSNSEGYSYISTTTSGSYIIYNMPYAELTIIKRSSYDNTAVVGVEFTLKGTSDLGNYYEQTLTTGEAGTLTFTELEPGTYTLQETSVENAETTVEADDTVRVVVVSEDGTITVDGEELNSYGNYTITNTEIASGTINVIKVWDVYDTSILYNDDGTPAFFPTIYLTTINPTAEE